MAAANFDADSYLFIGTNNAGDPYITLNPHADDHSHFNFGVIRFPLDGLNADESFYLALHLPFFVTGSIETGFGTSDTGEAEIAVVALGGSYDVYLQPSVSKRAWYDLNLHSQPVLGTIAFTSDEGDGLGWYYLDVTETVRAWLATPETAFGFGLYGLRGSVDLNSSDGPVETVPRLLNSRPLSYAAWSETYFETGQLGNEAVSGWEADPDGDGRSNGWEYHQGTEPLMPEESGVMGAFSVDGSALWWSAAMGSGRSDGALILEASDDFEAWTEVPAVERAIADGTVRVFLDGNTTRFLRLRLEKP